MEEEEKEKKEKEEGGLFSEEVLVDDLELEKDLEDLPI
jgi:hypothetical protein